MVRLLSGVALAAAALAAILYLPVAVLRVLAGLVALLAALEYLRLTKSDARMAGVALVGCLCASYGTAVSLSIVLVVAMAAVAFQVLARRDPMNRAAACGFAAVYVGGPLGLLVATHERYGWHATLLLIATIVVSDTAQYYSGRLLGRHPLAPTISPHKTIEGAVGGVVLGTLFVVVVGGRALPFVGAPNLVVLGIVIVVLGICGDLFESRMKREAGVKDSGDLIPGHGGVLDRIDALLFAVPAFYVYLGATT
jgi:phosphatidate cytidylyltransferase